MLLVVLPLLLTILFISGFVVFYNGLQHITLHSVHDIGGNTSMNIEPNCYNSFWTKEVTISNIKGYKHDLATRVTFYKTKKSTLHKTSKQLNTIKFFYNPNGVDYRSSMNYFLGNVPIYSAGNGTITYTFIARADINFTICPLELHIFDDYQKYSQYLQHSYDYYNSPISNPNCTLTSVNSTLQKFIVNFHLHPNTFYYFAVGLASSLYVNITISGILEEFRVSDLTPEKCFINSYASTRSCSFLVANSAISLTQDYICLLAHSNNINRGNVTVDVALAKWNAGSVICILFSFVTCFVTIGIIFSLILFITRHIKKESAMIARYNDLTTDD